MKSFETGEMSICKHFLIKDGKKPKVVESLMLIQRVENFLSGKEESLEFVVPI